MKCYECKGREAFICGACVDKLIKKAKEEKKEKIIKILKHKLPYWTSGNINIFIKQVKKEL